MTKRKDGRYQEVLSINGKKKYFYGATKAEVSRKVKEFQQNDRPRVTFKDVAEDWQNIHREEIGEKTWINYAPHYNNIVATHGHKPIEEVSALDIIVDLKRCAVERKSSTIISTRRSIYRMILDHALITGYIRYNPAIGVNLPKTVEKKRREAPSEEVFKTILENTDKEFGLFPAILACTGLRKSEALALTWGDIGKDTISVTKALDFVVHTNPVVKPPKTRAGIREVPIIDALRPFIVKPRNAKKSDLIFPSEPSNRNPNANGYMTEREYEGKWKRYCASVGFVDKDGKPTLTAHQLRHGMATMGFEAGVDELTMQRVLGHASPTTTRNIYTHLREQQLASSVSKLNESVSKIMSSDEEVLKNKEN